jgi:hypothetical protein
MRFFASRSSATFPPLDAALNVSGGQPVGHARLGPQVAVRAAKRFTSSTLAGLSIEGGHRDGDRRY